MIKRCWKWILAKAGRCWEWIESSGRPLVRRCWAWIEAIYNHFREWIHKSARPAFQRWWERTEAPDIKIGGLAATLIALLVVVPDWIGGWTAFTGGVHTEAYGLLMDALVFGVMIVWFNARRENREKSREEGRAKEARVQSYVDELEDFLGWEGEEGIRRTVGALKRLCREGSGKNAPYDLCLENANLLGAKLSGVNLSKANLRNANLFTARLNCACLSGADLSHADLRGAFLDSANLEAASLLSSKLEDADLTGATLIGADLTGADLNGANLTDANLLDVNATGAILHGANLSSARNLTQAQLDSAFGDEKTQVPEGLQRPSPKPNDSSLLSDD